MAKAIDLKPPPREVHTYPHILDLAKILPCQERSSLFNDDNDGGFIKIYHGLAPNHTFQPDLFLLLLHIYCILSSIMRTFLHLK